MAPHDYTAIEATHILQMVLDCESSIILQKPIQIIHPGSGGIFYQTNGNKLYKTITFNIVHKILKHIKSKFMKDLIEFLTSFLERN